MLASLLVPEAWPTDDPAVRAEVARLEARWKTAGLEPILRHLTGQPDSLIARVLRLCGGDEIDPALATFFARESGLRSYVLQVRRLSGDLIALGDSWSAAGHRDDGALAYGVAIAALSRSAASSSYAPLLLTAAERLPRACNRLATVADAQGRSTWAAPLRDAAARWDRLYAQWRDNAAGPANMLPNTGAAAYHPAEHRSAMLALAQVGVAFVALCTYAVLLLLAVVRLLVAACFRRRAGAVCWTTPQCGWTVGAFVLAVPTVAACGLLRLAGDDWSWVSSGRLVMAVILLVVVGHVSIATLAARQLLRGVEQTTTTAADRLSAGGRLLALLLATTGAVLIVARQPEARRAMVPPAVDFAVRLAWFWLAATVAVAIGARLWRLAHRLRPASRLSREGGSETGLAATRSLYPVASMAALGLVVHAALLLPLLGWNAQVFRAHSQKAAYTLNDEAAARLGAEWRARYTLSAEDLLSPLRPQG